MIKPPEHPLGPAFEEAREWEAQQQKLLTEQQRGVLDALKRRQHIERARQQERLEAVRKQLDERAKKRQPKPELALSPPVLVADPYIRRQARYIIAGEKRLTQLDRRHQEERFSALKSFEKAREETERAKSGQDLSASWKKALQKTAAQERDHDRARENNLDLDKSR
ncbi:MAG: hypothetical protein AB7S70_00390 [Hyphomicrobium sp.]|uniref:hypothetical protein n=1 Tax=Hyphomicrobium sp. TaxID=82 RepID=UPI003D12639D